MTEQEIDALANTYADKLWPTDMDGEGWIFQKEEIEGRESCIMDFKAGYKAAMQEIEKLKKDIKAVMEENSRNLDKNFRLKKEVDLLEHGINKYAGEDFWRLLPDKVAAEYIFDRGKAAKDALSKLKELRSEK